MTAVYCRTRMVRTPSGMPRANTSRPSRLRVISWAAALRMASSRFRRNASRAASSSPVGWSSAPASRGSSSLRLEVGEPRRHHQVVGGQLQPQLARLGDELEILLGQRQHGDLGQVHLLRARQRQQHVERTLEAVEADDQRLVGARSRPRRPPRPRSSGSGSGAVGCARCWRRPCAAPAPVENL